MASQRGAFFGNASRISLPKLKKELEQWRDRFVENEFHLNQGTSVCKGNLQSVRLTESFSKNTR